MRMSPDNNIHKASLCRQIPVSKAYTLIADMSQADYKFASLFLEFRRILVCHL